MKTQVDSDLYTYEDVQTLLQNPYLIGHLANKTKLSSIHSEWIKYIWSTYKERSLQAHRGSYKTTSMAVGAVIWMLSHPDDRIFIIRKKFTDASEIVANIVEMMLVPEIAELFRLFYGEKPGTKIKRKELVSFNFKSTITPEGNLNACGLDASLTGKHGDFFLLDDFVTLRDRVSVAERETTIEIVREIATNVVDPGKPVRYVGTPWHRLDAWSICPKPLKYSVHDLDILSEEEVAEKRKTTTGSLFAANYLLEHVSDEDALFKNPVMGQWVFGSIDRPRAHLDAAFDGDHYCALTIMARRSNGKIQAIGIAFRGNVKTWIKEIVNQLRKYKCKKIYNEDNPDKGYTSDLLKKEGLFVHTYNETTNKHIKISSHLVEAWKDIIWDENTDDEYMNQLLDYAERQEPDDAPDSAASLIRACFQSKNAIRSERWKW